MQPAASGSGFSVLLKMFRVLFSIWFSIQRIIKKCPGYYSQSVSKFNVLLKNVQGIIQRMIQYSAYYQKKCKGYYSESGSGVSVLLEIFRGIIQESGYCSKYD